MIQGFLKPYTGKRLLVTGGAGFLGSGLIQMLSSVPCEVIRVSRRSQMPFSMAGPMQMKHEVGDIREQATWQRLLQGVEVIFHFAAQTSTTVASKDPTGDFDANVLPMLHLIETCRQQGLHPDVLFAGTVTEAGLPVYLPVDEAHPDHPATVYDQHKWDAEQALKQATEKRTVCGASLRLANVYGPGPKNSSSDRGILNRMIHKALHGEPLTIYGEGSQIRDYLYVEDAALAFLAGGLHVEQLNGQHFVIGSGEGHPLAEAFHLVADQVASVTGRPVEVQHVEPPSPLSPIEARNFVADSRRFSQRTGWMPRVGFKEGIARTIQGVNG